VHNVDDSVNRCVRHEICLGDVISHQSSFKCKAVLTSVAQPPRETPCKDVGDHDVGITITNQQTKFALTANATNLTRSRNEKELLLPSDSAFLYNRFRSDRL